MDKSFLLLTDFQLLDKIREGQQSALKILYDRYADDLFVRARGILKKKEDAEEVVQDVFVKLWNYRNTISVHSSVKAYLFQMCRNLVFDYIKVRAQSLPFIPLDSTPAKSEAQDSTESQIQFDEYYTRYFNAVEALPPGRKRVYQLCHVEGRSYEQVAEQLSISRDAVKDHIVKATRFLKKCTIITEQAVATLLLFTYQLLESMPGNGLFS